MTARAARGTPPPAKDRRRRTQWFNRRTEPPVHVGVYECAVRLCSAQRRVLILWDLPWDGRGFLVPCPMVVVQWRGLRKRPTAPGAARR